MIDKIYTNTIEIQNIQITIEIKQSIDNQVMTTKDNKIFEYCILFKI